MRRGCMIGASLALGTLLTACGGGSTGLAFTPPPPPPAPPTAVPPFPNGSTLTFYTTTHSSASGTVRVESLEGGRVRVTGIDQLSSAIAEGAGNFQYRGPNSYAVEFAGFGGPSFTPDDLVPASGPFDTLRTSLGSGHFANLELARPGTGVTLSYTTFGNIIESFGEPGDSQITFFAAGSLTPPRQIPTTGTATFSGVADGLWVDGGTTRRLFGSQATLTANFGAGEVTSRLDLRGHDNAFGDFLSAPTTTLGTFTGTGRIGSNGFFSGTYSPAAGYSGSFGGALFGPSAEEFGLSFELTGSAGQTAFGAAAGKRQ